MDRFADDYFVNDDAAFHDDATLVLMLQHQLTVLRMWRHRGAVKGLMRRRGSVPRCRPNKRRDFETAVRSVRRDYIAMDG